MDVDKLLAQVCGEARALGIPLAADILPQVRLNFRAVALGLPDQKPVNHLAVCERCGQEFKRARASNLVQHPERYRCRCGGRLSLRY